MTVRTAVHTVVRTVTGGRRFGPVIHPYPRPPCPLRRGPEPLRLIPQSLLSSRRCPVPCDPCHFPVDIDCFFAYIPCIRNHIFPFYLIPVNNIFCAAARKLLVYFFCRFMILQIDNDNRMAKLSTGEVPQLLKMKRIFNRSGYSMVRKPPMEYYEFV